MKLKVTVVTPIFPIPSQPNRGHSEYEIVLVLSKHADAKDSQALAKAMETAIERNWDERSISHQFHRSWNEAAEELLRTCELAMQQRAAEWRLPVKPAAAISR